MIRLLPALLALGLTTGALARDVAETQVQVLEALARQDWAEAQSLWLPLADAGEPEAEYQLGLLFATAPDPYRNRAGARDFLTRAADHGHREANYRLGLLLMGTGPAEEAEALTRFKTAASAGHVLAASEVARRDGKSPSFRFALPDPNAPRPPDSWAPQVVTRAPDPVPPPTPGRPDAVVRTFPMPAPKPPAPAVTVDHTALVEAAPPPVRKPAAPPTPPPPEAPVAAVKAPEPSPRPVAKPPEPKPAPEPVPVAAKPAAAGDSRIRVAALRDASSLKPFERDFFRKTADWRDGLSLTQEVGADGWTRVYLGRLLPATEAQSLCRALKERQVDCVVVR